MTGQPAVGSRPWLHAFAMQTRLATRLAFEPQNTCIASSVLGAHVLDRYGVNNRLASVWVRAHNAKAARLENQRVPVTEWPDDAWSVVIHPRSRPTDKPHDGTGWDGHLVLLLRAPDRTRTLIDLTADQFDRPARRLEVGGPVFMDIAPGKPWTPQDPMISVIGGFDRLKDPADNPTIVEYMPAAPKEPTANQWRDTPDFRRWGDPTAPETVEVVDSICEAIDADVARTAGRAEEGR